MENSLCNAYIKFHLHLYYASQYHNISRWFCLYLIWLLLLPTHFKSSINKAKTRSYPGADISSDFNLVLMNLKSKLKVKCHNQLHSLWLGKSCKTKTFRTAIGLPSDCLSAPWCYSTTTFSVCPLDVLLLFTPGGLFWVVRQPPPPPPSPH